MAAHALPFWYAEGSSQTLAVRADEFAANAFTDLLGSVRQIGERDHGATQRLEPGNQALLVSTSGLFPGDAVPRTKP